MATALEKQQAGEPNEEAAGYPPLPDRGPDDGPRGAGGRDGAGDAVDVTSRQSAHRADGPASGPPYGGDAGRSGGDAGPPPAYPPRPSGPAPVPSAASAVPWGLRVTAEVAWRLVVVAAAVYVVLIVIGSLKLVVLAFAASLLMAALLQPTVAWLRRHGMPRALAAALTFIAGLAALGLIGWFVYWQVSENIDELTGKMQDALGQMRTWASHGPLHLSDKQITDITKSLSNALGTNTEKLTSAGVTGVTVIIEVLSGVALAAFSTFFLIYDGERIWNWLLKLFPPIARGPVAGAGPRAWSTLTNYIRGTVVIAFIDAVSIGIGIALLGVPLAIPLTVVVFLGAFVPLIGALVSGALAVAVGLVTHGVVTALLVLAVLIAVQQIEGHLLQPLILGRAVKVHPLAVVMAVASGSLLAGIGGAVVAVPLVAVLNTVVSYLMRYRKLKVAAASGGGATTGAEAERVAGPTLEQAEREAEEDEPQ
ncbi:AI-2E family transporter [Mangrovactinospora gilvigrisea]|uniref:AI-2E family transporter n=1 Tax=Mangrovactinospora gilvigrisea TaxID=1428644 RepID=A0A1J7CBB7_9ACTN|nr:AI-2E family transporter [Mangrovactinospora gilvigrisea]